MSDQVTGNISTVFFQISKKNNILSQISGSPTTASWLLAYGLGYGGKVSDLVVAGLQLSLRSPGNDPTEPLAVWLGALGCGIFSQAFPSQLPHTNQVAISDLPKREGINNMHYSYNVNNTIDTIGTLMLGWHKNVDHISHLLEDKPP